ncbi:MAG: GNAT family N-acetyltransferase [bacterium]|nr:GNAT family N-acetyltransferase [bacterium]
MPVEAPDHLHFVYELSSSDTNPQWSHRGKVATFEEFLQAPRGHIFSQFVVVRCSDGLPIGYVVGYQLDERNGHAAVSVCMVEEHQASVASVEGFALFVDYLFRHWDLRKLYGEVLDFNLERFQSSLGRWFTIEGCFRKHEYVDGCYRDVYYLACYRDGFNTAIERFRKYLGGSSKSDTDEVH